MCSGSLQMFEGTFMIRRKLFDRLTVATNVGSLLDAYGGVIVNKSKTPCA